MEREQMKEIIERNREALGMDVAESSELIDALVSGNILWTVGAALAVQRSHIILADGLIIGFKS